MKKMQRNINNKCIVKVDLKIYINFRVPNTKCFVSFLPIPKQCTKLTETYKIYNIKIKPKSYNSKFVKFLSTRECNHVISYEI